MMVIKGIPLDQNVKSECSRTEWRAKVLQPPTLVGYLKDLTNKILFSPWSPPPPPFILLKARCRFFYLVLVNFLANCANFCLALRTLKFFRTRVIMYRK